jgi:hypothetical protein
MKMVDSEMTYRQSNVFMGGVMRPPEFLVTVTDSAKVQRVKAAAEQ